MNRFPSLWHRSAVSTSSNWTQARPLVLGLAWLWASATGSSTAQEGAGAAAAGAGGGGGTPASAGRSEFASPGFAREGLPFGYLLGGYDANPDAGPGLVPGRLAMGAVKQGFSAELGSSITYSTNLFQEAVDQESGMLSTSDFSLHYHYGENRRMGVFFGIDYDLAYFRYFDEELNEGREPFSHNVSGFIGVKGAQTTITLSGSLVQDNGNGLNQARQTAETLQSESTDYSFNLAASRTLRRTSLQAGLGYRLQKFDDQPGDGNPAPEGQAERLTDLTSWDGNLGWSVSPLGMQKVNFQPTLGFGASEQDAGVEQTYLNPTLGVAYTYDSKLSFFGSIGADIRRTTSTTDEGEEEEFTETAPTFELGVSWQADKKTSLGVSIYRRTLASALQGQSSSDSTGITFTASKAFPRGFFTSIDYSLENSSYTDIEGEESDPGAGGTISGTPEFYHRFGAIIGRQKKLRGTMSLSASLFYQYNLSESDNPLDEFDQSVVGLRLGLDF
ncbi:MAG: hypothetical protein V4675_05125 [Verrucomicrobiota bacterium]